MGVDSRDVDRELTASFWRDLRSLGFRRKGRTAWRRRSDSIDVVNVQSLGSYLGQSLGATSCSFMIRLGVFYPAIVQASGGLFGPQDPEHPPEYACHARRTPAKGIAQPLMQRVDARRSRWARLFNRPPLISDRDDCYFVAPDGSNLVDLVRDASQRTHEDGLPWFDRMADLRTAIAIFESQPDMFTTGGVAGDLYGGAIGSPQRSEFVEALRVAIDRAVATNQD